MSALPTLVSAVPGLRYCPDFLASDEEKYLLSVIDQQPWLSDLKRRVQHYGYRYDYKSRAIHAEMRLGPLPEWAMQLASRLRAEGIVPAVPDQVIVNEYLPGQGIASHIDCQPCFGESILSLSLGSPCVMVFSRPELGQQVPILLEPRSLVVMQGDSRHLWKHAIPSRKSDTYAGRVIQRGRRVSITLRNVIL